MPKPKKEKMPPVEESLELFLDDRLDKILDTLKENPEYAQLNEESEKLYSDIKELISEKVLKMFLKYDNAEFSLYRMRFEFAYTQGLKDGTELRKFLENQA